MVKYCFASNYAVPANPNASDFWISAKKKKEKYRKEKRNINERSMDIIKADRITKKRNLKKNSNNEEVNQKGKKRTT